MTSARGSYEVHYLQEPTNSPNEANLDVIVQFASGLRYAATFFTLENIERLMDGYSESGECAGGLYVWSTQMIVIRQIARAAIESAIADLITSGEFDKAFCQLE